MKQARFMSLIEAKTNAGVGLFVSWGFSYWGLPLFGLTPSPTQAAGITGCYFILSFLRSYFLRRIFNSFSN